MSAVRLLELRLLAFGAFSGEVLRLGARPDAVQLVYGPNEAGKSTALRAIRALLFGIPEKTRDGYRHAMKELRVGGRLARGDGSALDVVRRKGRKNTLLGVNDESLEDDALEPFLGGASEEVFMAMYGLTHESLRSGGEALLRGQGDIGETLFDAARGGQSVAELLEKLRKEADALFKPRGRNVVILGEISAYQQAKKRVRELSLRPERFSEQKRAVDAERRLSEELAGAQRQLRTEKERLLRIQRAAPLVAERLELLRERRELAGGVLVEPGVRALRERMERALDDARREKQHVEAEIGRLELRRASLAPPVSLESVPEDVILDLRERLGSHRKAHQDQPKLRGQEKALESRMERLRSALGRSGPADDDLPIERGARARLEELALGRVGIEQGLTDARRRESESRLRLSVAEAELDVAGPPEPDPELEALVIACERSKLPEELAELRHSRDRSKGRVGAQALALGLDASAVVRLIVLPVPELEAVEQALADARALDEREERVEDERQKLELRRRETEAELEALARQGEVPTEDELAEKRRERDELFERTIEGRGDADAEGAALVRRYRHAAGDADRLADRMRREADRINRHAQLRTELSELERRDTELSRSEQALVQRRSELSKSWRGLWQPSRPAQPFQASARSWLRHFSDLRREAQALEALEADIEERAAAHAELTARLKAALSRAGVELEDEGPQAVLAARIWLGRAEESRRTRDTRLRDLRQIRAEEQSLTRLVAEREAELRSWQVAWQGAVSKLGLAPDTQPEAARALFEGLTELGTLRAELEHLRRRIHGIERDSEEFSRQIESLLQSHAPELVGNPVAEAAATLFRRYDEARKLAAEREKLALEEQERRAALFGIEHALRGAELEIGELFQRSGARSLEELKAAEAASERLVQIDQRLRDLDAQLFDVRGSTGLEALIVEVQAEDPMALRVRLVEIEDELADVDERHQAALVQVGNLERGLEIFDTSSGAAEAAAEAEATLAALERHVTRYARLRLAVRVLERELERYRERHQGPIVSRAAELLRELTLGRYSGLRAEYTADDHPMLACVEAGGNRVSVADLSDGTRDQLYLALRLSTLELQAKRAGPLPLILDDVFVHFDDARTEVALSVLGGLASLLQIIVFTHHARVVELARRALAPERLVVHELSAPSLS